MPDENYEVIIVGGSYAGLSSAMTLGRSLRRTLIVDAGRPCNRQTPHSHNMLTRDGETPSAIREEGLRQVLTYPSVSLESGTVTTVEKNESGFLVQRDDGAIYGADKVLFTTGMIDVHADIPGFGECWGISVLHCPYCHGYEVRGRRTAVLANGDAGFDVARLIDNWTDDVVLLTNGPSTLNADQTERLARHGIDIVERKIGAIDQANGHMRNVVFTDGGSMPLSVMYARVPTKQHSDIPHALGCERAESGLITVDTMQRTTVPGVYAAGDCTTMFRSVAAAIASGNMAGAAINRELIEERF